MNDLRAGPNHGAAAAEITSCELCVIGAGLAGLNALWVATEYLPKGSRVVLIDRHPRCGGMWTETYDFARLHQPHPYFTVGDISWNWNKPAEHLATKDEILDHLEYCLDVLRKKFSLVELFHYEANLNSESNLAIGQNLIVECTALDVGRSNLIVDAKQVIVARGNEVPVATPLALSSNAVASATPVNLADHLRSCDDAPVFIVGSGKTGMDVAYQLVTGEPERAISMIAGRGTAFFDRAHVAPQGRRPRWKAKLLLKIFGDIAMRCDGSNYDEAFAYFRRQYALALSGAAEHCFFGYLSDSECKAIETGLSEKIDEYLEDVIDTSDGPAALFRSGRTQALPRGSIIVNCTGFLLRGESSPVECISRGGTLLNISSQGSLHFLSSVSAYFLTHLFFSERRAKAPVYAMDTAALFAIDRRAWFMASTTQAFMNTLVLLDALSTRTFDRCGLNTDRQFPLPRIIAVLVDMKVNRRKYVKHCRQSLDRIAQRYDVRCGEIDWS